MPTCNGYPTPANNHPTDHHGDHYSELIAAGLRYAAAVTAARATSATHTEAEDTVRLADAEAIDAHNADWEAHLNVPAETGNCMGFTTSPNQREPVDLDASDRAAAFAKMGFERSRAEVIRSKVHAVKASREAEAAEANLLAVAADLAPVDRPAEPASRCEDPVDLVPTVVTDHLAHEAQI